jgi:hypothetical protein
MYYITVSNGLLTPEHKRKIGSAVWEFMWCLDKITRVDAKGMGWVLGGKPVKLHEIGMGHDNTTSRNLAKLEEEGYLVVTRTPYGLSIKVCKAKKRFTKSSDSPKPVIHQNLESPTGNGESPTNNGESKKTVSVDKVIDKTIVSPFLLKEEIKKLEESARRDIQIIGYYLSERKPDIRNKGQFNLAIRRHLRAAKALIPFDDDQLVGGFKKAKAQTPEWVLETVVKMLTK